MQRSIRTWTTPVGILIVGAIAIYLAWPKPDPPDNLTCDLRATSTANSPSFSNLTAPIATIRISGLTTASSQQTLYSFNGDATVTTSQKKIDAAATGSVFIDQKGQPNGLVVEIQSDEFAPHGLHIMTLRKDGVLDFSTTQAFVMSDPTPGSPRRLSYPVSMRCSAIAPK